MKKRILTLLLLISIGFINQISAQQTKVKTKQKTETPEQVYDIANPMPVFGTKMPIYVGQETAIDDYFKKALAGNTFNTGGTITLSMVIDKTGQPKNVEIIKGLNKETDDLVLAAARKMPKWQQPGKQNGQPVSVRMNVPVTVTTPAEQEAQRKMDELIFTFVEQQPTFPGGEIAMLDYLKANIKYPSAAQAKKAEGRVILQFVVSRTGEIKDPTVLKGVTPEIDAEAIRVIKSMPTWIPGKQNGRPVNVRFTMPVLFKLDTPE